MDNMEENTRKIIINQYKITLRNINKMIESYYKKYSNDGILSFDDMANTSNLVALQKKIIKILYKNYNFEYSEIVKLLKETYSTNYYKTAFFIEKTSNLSASYSILPTNQIIASIEDTGTNLGLKELNEKQRDHTIKKVKEVITDGIVNGNSIKEMTKNLTNRLDISSRVAEMTTRTENNRVRNKGTNDSYVKAEVKGIVFKKMWVSTLDSRTRHSHQDLDGKFADDNGYFHYKGYKTLYPGGFGRAELDINCRCTTIAKFDNVGTEKRKENIKTDGEKKIISYKNYNDWYSKNIQK